MRSAALVLLLLITSASFGREWSDATGKFRVQAQLKVVADGKVVLMTDDGREITVPVERLDLPSRGYVRAWQNRGEGKPPKLPPHSVVVADFRMVAADGTGYKTENSRVAVVKWPKVSKSIVISCTAPVGNSTLGIDLDNLGKFVGKFEVLDAVDRSPLSKASGPVSLKGVQAARNVPALKHAFMAFYLEPKSKAAALTIADRSPEPGDKVWALAAGENSTPKENPLLSATVDRIEENMMIIKYDEEKVVAEQYIGAVLVDFAGDVIGLQTSHLGKNTAMATKVEDIREKFKAALDK